MNDDPVIRRLDWQQLTLGQVQYQFHLKPKQQWGYKLRYEGTSLILSLRHPPPGKGLANVKVLLDPGHGSKNDLGSRGPTGVPEKDVTLVVSQRLQQALQKRGATVVMTRTGDEDLYPQDRVNIINRTEPTIAISVHYNALPDSGDALNTAGVGAFWYHPQSHDLATFLHHYLVSHLKRPDYGIFWNNLALTRPTVAPSVLMELGFMIHPTEFEWITDAKAQEELAETMAEAIAAWFSQP
jgi:N-acetylmuramoyl-L-alanine amidase